MQIAVDAGGLCVDQGYGNYIFSINILRALAKLDQENTYTAYTFCDRTPFQSRTFRYKKIWPKFGFMKVRVSFEEMLHRKKIFLALNQAIPLITKSEIITFSHGLSYLFYKELYKDDFKKLRAQLYEYAVKSSLIIVSSSRVKEELLGKMSISQDRVITLLPGIPYDFQSYITLKRKKYLLFVGMNHPIKNVDGVLKLFLEFKKQTRFKDYSLYLVGSFEDYESKDVRVFPKLNRQRLKLLYQESAAYISTSHYESFNFPVLEALSQNCPVVAMNSAVIPEMKPFVNIVANEKQFFDALSRVCSKTQSHAFQNDLKAVFSWEKYVGRLITLYNEL